MAALSASVHGGRSGQSPRGRALYLGHSVFRIHGTNQPETILHAVSSGCFRLDNADVIDLYDRVQVGAKVLVRPVGPRFLMRTRGFKVGGPRGIGDCPGPTGSKGTPGARSPPPRPSQGAGRGASARRKANGQRTCKRPNRPSPWPMLRNATVSEEDNHAPFCSPAFRNRFHRWNG